MLAITHEGYNVAEWLRDHGIAAFVLKHRLAREAESTYKIDVESLADTQRAIRLIRSRAEEWNIDVSRIGAIGFSAGGELVSMAATKPDSGSATAADPIDRESSALHFQALDLSRPFRRHPADEGIAARLPGRLLHRSPGHFRGTGRGLSALQARRRGRRAAHLQHRWTRLRPARDQQAARGQLDCALRGVAEREWIREVALVPLCRTSPSKSFSPLRTPRTAGSGGAKPPG